MTDEKPIPSNPAEALATVAVIPETDVAQAEGRMESAKARKDEARVSSREAAEKRGEDALKKEFPDLFKAGETEQPEAKATAPSAEGSKEPKSDRSGEAEPDPSPRQLGRADDILKRAGLSKERIEAMSPKDRMALGKELKPKVIAWQQAEQQKTDPNFKARESIASNGQAGSPAGEPHDSLPPELKETIAALARDSSPEFTANLEKLFDAKTAPLRAELNKAKAELARKDEATLKANIENAREALADRFHELEDDETFEADVLPFMAGLANTGRYDLTDAKVVQKLVAQAAVAAELQEASPQAKAEEEQVARLTRNGAASSRSKTTPYAGKTRDEKIALAAKLAQDPSVSIEDARRRVWGS